VPVSLVLRWLLANLVMTGLAFLVYRLLGLVK
jgi:hypothetical protein